MEETTLVIAIVGASTGLASLAWQVYSWHHARKPKIDVSVSWALLGLDPQVIEVVQVTVVNNNDHAIRITGVGVNMQDGSGRQFHFTQQMPVAALPGTIPAHDAASGFLERTQFERAGLDIYRPIVAWARSSAHGEFRSPRTTLMTR